MVTTACTLHASRKACKARCDHWTSSSLPVGIPNKLEESFIAKRMAATAPNESQKPGVYGAIGSINKTSASAHHQISNDLGFLPVHNA